MRVLQYIEQIARQFEQAPLYYGHGTDNPLDEAAYLVCASLGLDFADENLLGSRVLDAAELAQLDLGVRQRVDERMPVAYITGQAWFAGHRFYADRRALIPRSPIAELITNRFEPLLSQDPGTVLDLCTGGGCIGIATALTFPEARVVLADVSADALALAASNVELHGLHDRITTVRSDLFSSVQGKFDLIVCNPPYVSQSEIAALPAEYGSEPVLGLLSEEEGLQLPLRILEHAAQFLNETGLLIMEVGYSHSLLSERLPTVPLLWIEFENGGEGVFALTTSQLRQFRSCFS